MTKKLLTIAILALIALAGVFWFTQNQEKSTVSSQREETLEENQTPEEKKDQEIPETSKEEDQTSKITYNPDNSIDTSDWKEYCNKEYGFCLKYPGEWEGLKINKDKCLLSEDEKKRFQGKKPWGNDPCESVRVSIRGTKYASTFLSLQTEKYDKYNIIVKKGPYFGDTIADIINISSIDDYCDDFRVSDMRESCSVFTTKNSIQMIKIKQIIPFTERYWEDIYYIKWDDIFYKGMVLSTRNLPYPYEQSKKIMEEIIASLKVLR